MQIGHNLEIHTVVDVAGHGVKRRGRGWTEGCGSDLQIEPSQPLYDIPV